MMWISKTKYGFGTSLALVTLITVIVVVNDDSWRAGNNALFYSTGKSITKWLMKVNTVFSQSTSAQVEHAIVVFNPDFSPLKYNNETLTSRCTYTNCRLTTDRSNLRNASAILFFLTVAPKLPELPPLLPSERNPDQAWIFSWLESPIHHNGDRAVYKTKNWRGTANWTMSYLHDADIVLPYGQVTKRTHRVIRNYSDIFRRKTKIAAWVVSNCHTQSKREIYVEKLVSFGVDVDIYGGCAGKSVNKETIRRVIDRDYKFYLSFENSLCKDYITEKFFSYFQLDVIPIVRGGGNYSALLNERAFVNTASFSAIKQLAEYLLTVASSEQLYTEYLRNKDNYVSGDTMNIHSQSYCEICRKLNNLESNRRTYEDLVHAIHDGTCYAPNDLK